jgi:cell division septum initiation protein DivIVA
MDYKLALDLIIAVLLAATIVYAAILNGKLNQLRKNRDDLAKLVAAFNDATVRAEAGIPKLKRVSEEASSTLVERVEKAQSLRDDLAFMIERADAMANRLEGAVRSARVDVKPSPAPQAGARPARPATTPGSASPAAQSPAAPPAAAAAAAPLTASRTDDFDDDRSEAERELLRALQAVR